MKKLGLILFIGCLIGACFTGNQCARKAPVLTPIDTGTTITNHPKDTSGETLYITCKDGITVSAHIVPGAVIYLVNNYDDYTNWKLNNKMPPKSAYRMRLADASGKCEFDTVRPPSETVKHTNYPGHTGGYIYNLIGFKIDPTTGDTDKVMLDAGQAYDGVLGNPITVNENNNPKLPHNVSVVFP